MIKLVDALRLGFVAIVLALLAPATHGNAVAAPVSSALYAVTDLGTLPPFDMSVAHAINATGEVVGRATDANYGLRAFRYSNGQMQDLGPGALDAFDINASGQIVGVAGGDTPAYAFLYSGGILAALGQGSTVASAINDRGEIAGQADGGRAFIYSNGVLRDLGTLPGDSAAYAIGITAIGHAAGASFTNCQQRCTARAFLYDGVGLRDLSGSLNATSSTAVALNDRDEVVVNTELLVPGSAYYHAFLYRGGSLHDLDPGGSGGIRGAGINNVGQVVGEREGHAFLYSGGQRFDLNTFISPAAGWQLTAANDINDAGQIVGEGLHNGLRRAFLLTPRFADLTPDTPYLAAILALADQGIIQGYENGRFGPADHALRAQSAAFIARAVGWDAEDWPDATFADQGTVDDDLWRNVRTLAHHQIALGYEDGTYNPTGEVLEQQVILFVARTLVATGAWVEQTDISPYPNLPNATAREQADRRAIATYIHYAGAVSDRPTGQAWADWGQPATRGWFAQALWQALASTP